MADKLYLSIGLPYTDHSYPRCSAAVFLTEPQEKAFASAHGKQRKVGKLIPAMFLKEMIQRLGCRGFVNEGTTSKNIEVRGHSVS